MLVYYICSFVTSAVRNEKWLSFVIINMTKTELVYMYMFANGGIVGCCKFIWQFLGH